MRTALSAFAMAILGLLHAGAQPAPADASPHVGAAVRLMEDRRLDEAAAEFEQALAADPNNDAVRIEYATCLFAQERNDEARKQFETEHKRLGSRPGLDYYLGQLDLRAGDFAAAIEKLGPLESNAALPKASFYLGLAYLSAGRQDKALESLERAARTNPYDAETHYRLARVYSMVGRAAEADREYKLYRDAREGERIAEQGGHDCAEALRTQPIEKARTMCEPIGDRNDARRLVYLGHLYCDAGAFSDAVAPLRRAVELEPDSFEASQYLGLSLFQLGRYQEALPPLRKAAALNPQYFSSLTLLASALHAAGDDAAALPVLERAHQLNPADAQVTKRIEELRATVKGK